MDLTREKKIEIREKVSSFRVFYNCIVIYVVLRIISTIAISEKDSILEIPATIFLAPILILDFKDMVWNYAFGIGSGFILLFFATNRNGVKNLFSLYMWSFLWTYLFSISANFFLEIITISIPDLKTDSGYIANMVIAMIFLLFVLFLLYCSIDVLFQTSFGPRTPEDLEQTLENNKNMRIENNKRQESIRKEKFNNTDKHNKSYDNGPPNPFVADEKLVAKISKQMEHTSLDTKLSFDTNILIKTPLLVKELSNKYPIFLSKQVYEELDRKKTDNELGANVRMAMRAIEYAQLRGKGLKIASVDEEFLEKNSNILDIQNPDDFIIGCCLKQKLNGEKIFFISEDRGARTKAINEGLDVMPF